MAVANAHVVALTLRTSPVTLLLDGYSLLFRAFYALPPMCTTAGEPTGALYGTAVLLLKLLREERPDRLAIAVDAPGATVRHTTLPSYKAGRPGAPDPLRVQLARFPELAAAFGVPLHRVPAWEADDVLATLTRRLRPSLVVSGDTDLLQVVDAHTQVLFVGRRQADHVRYDVNAVHARYGISPERIPTYKALCGDPSDNLPGVAGIGPKTAARLIAAHGDARGIAAARGSLPTKLAEALAGDEWVAHEAIATVRTDLPLEEPLAAQPDLGDAVDHWFETLEFKSLRLRLELLRRATT